MSHRRKSSAVRAGLYAFRAARAGTILAAMVGVLVGVVALCIAGDPTR